MQTEQLKQVKSYLTKFLFLIWTLPQTICGGVFYFYLWIANKRKPYLFSYYNRHFYFVDSLLEPVNAITLGYFIFQRFASGERITRHELGHDRQQLYLGWLFLPLYLIVTGVQRLFGVAQEETLFEKRARESAKKVLR